jgi:hypothetical protein
VVLSQIVGTTSQRRQTPYITPDMFKYHRRRGVQVDNLVPRGTPDEQDAALAEIIESASVWVDNLLLPLILAATQDTVLVRANVNRRGEIRLHPRYRPAIALTSVAVGATPNSMQTYNDLTGCAVEPERITIPTQPWGLTTSAGPLQFGAVTTAPMDQVWVQYTYQNGYPVTLLTAPAAAGATSLPVADTTGIVAGQTQLTIYDLQRRFRFTAGTVSTAASGGVGTGPGTVTCPALPYAIPNSGNYPTMVTGLPPDAIEAVVLVIRAMVKESSPGSEAAAAEDYIEAEATLHPYLIAV